jgi:metacaspase-1
VLTLCLGRHENPNSDNIKAGIAWLVSGAKSGDNLFMHYSGHGGSMRDQDKDEADGMDETLIPVDYDKKGQIRDDDVYDMLVTKIPAGCHLTVIMDCCHSGTILDLPYLVKGDNSTIEAVETGAIPSVIQPNPNFSGRLMKLGIELAAMGIQGASAKDIQTHIMNNVMAGMVGMLQNK